MGANQNSISNLSKNKYTIKAQSTATISFMGSSPNYYRITNGGSTALYLGVSMMPTENFFDMKLTASTTKLYVDAFGREEIYIYNPSITDANIIITSFNAPFDSSVLALSDIGQDFSQIDFSGSVDATGDLKTLLNQIDNKIKDYSDQITEIETILNSIKIPCTKFYSGENTDAENLYTMKFIKTLSNDSDTDLIAVFGSDRCILKSGEVINNVLLDGVKTIKIPKYSTYRLIGG